MKSFGLRLLGALALVLATYNPEGRSFTHWVLEGQDGLTPLKAFVGVVLTIGWVFVFTSTWRSLGFIGTGLAVALVGTGIWLALDWTHASLGARAITWLALGGVALVLAGGMTWSSARRRVGGQAEVREAGGAPS
jgi:hypothetical protein